MEYTYIKRGVYLHTILSGLGLGLGQELGLGLGLQMAPIDEIARRV